jgi:hypothetical protein
MDRSVAPPNGAFDAGLRTGPFPDRPASLLPGSLAITQTGLTPAGDDELLIRSWPLANHLRDLWAHRLPNNCREAEMKPEKSNVNLPTFTCCCANNNRMKSVGASLLRTVEREGETMADKASHERWVLAFDAACGTCRAISETVREACGDRLEILPLAHHDVRRLLARAFAENAPFRPTLIQVRGEGDVEADSEEVRAWTSWRMAVPLTRRLGLRTTLRLLGELGSRPSAQSDQPAGRQSHAISRKNFLRVAAGTATAAGLLLAGGNPALAKQRTTAAAWVAANKDKLPQAYAAFTAYPVDYRREIYKELSAPTRARLWREHFGAYRAAHPSLSTAQRDALTQVERFVADDNVLDSTRAAKTEQHEAMMQQLQASVNEAFGEQEAYKIVAILGPAPSSQMASAGPRPPCECSTVSDYCGDFIVCCDRGPTQCNVTPTGCGFLWQYSCNGFCDYASHC